MKENISQEVSKWIEEEAEPKIRMVCPVRTRSPWYGMSDEEIEDRKEYIRWYFLKDFELVLMIPVQPRESDFWFATDDEFKESAFNTWDFERTQRPFDKYGYRIKKVMERVKDLALLHSCISQPEGRENVRKRFEIILDNEFRSQLLDLVERYRTTYYEERRVELRYKIARINRHIMECKKIWEQYAPWEG
jgi:hypothetical protein